MVTVKYEKIVSREFRTKMPMKSKIPSVVRRGWLERYESGERQDDIAKKDKVNPRTVRDHLERARQERDFESAQREHLREALRAHQDDMLELIGRVNLAAEVPPLGSTPASSLDHIFEDSASATQVVTVPTHPLETSARPGEDRNPSPREIHLADEGTRLWRALKEHLGKDRLWRDIGDWKRSLLDEVEAREALSRAITEKAEATFGLPVNRTSREPRLTTTLVRLIDVEVTKRALGEPASDLTSRLQADGERLDDPITSTYLAEHVAEPARVKDGLPLMIEELVASPEAERAAQTHRDLQHRSRKVRETAEEYILLHHIRGRCSLCRKLGG